MTKLIEPLPFKTAVDCVVNPQTDHKKHPEKAVKAISQNVPPPPEGRSTYAEVSNKVAFGRHETFALRYGWLSKGFQAFKKNNGIFKDPDVTVALGVGKNMVQAIFYWLRASQMIHPTEAKPTDIGIKLLSAQGFDPYLEDEATVWLIHWLLASNAELATSWYWFFNKYHKTEFTGQELATALVDFVNDKLIDRKKPALTTLKNDALLLPRMYTQSKGNTRTPLEETLDSPLALLRLVTQTAGGRSYQSRPEARPELPIGILGFAICQLFEQRQLTALPIDELMYNRDNDSAPGAVFRLSESGLITKLEQLVDYIPGIFEIRETAGLYQLYQLKSVDPIEFIERHYNGAQQGNGIQQGRGKAA